MTTNAGAPTPPDPRPGGDRVYYPGLDGLRAVAIALIYLFHDRELNLLDRLATWASLPLALLVDPALRLVGLPEISFRVRGFVSPIREHGWVGVNLFFVLSGYLIATLLLRERERYGRIDLRAFWARRILRIWPLYYLALLMCFGLMPMARAAVGIDPGPWRELAVDRLPAFLAFLGNWSLAIQGPAGSDAISVLWSVCVEEQFYLVVPLLVAWTGGRWRLGIVAGLMAAAVACRYALAASGTSGMALRFNTFANLDSLLAGVMLALVVRRGLPGGPASRWAVRAAVVAGAVAVYAAPLSLGGPWRRAADDVLIWAWAVALVSWASGDDRWAGLLRRPTLVWLGRISYGLYIYHEIALGIASWAYRAVPPLPEKELIFALLGPALTVGLASASYYGFERPFLRLKDRWTRVPSRPIGARGVGSKGGGGPGDGIMSARTDDPEPPPGRPSTPDLP